MKSMKIDTETNIVFSCCLPFTIFYYISIYLHITKNVYRSSSHFHQTVHCPINNLLELATRADQQQLKFFPVEKLLCHRVSKHRKKPKSLLRPERTELILGKTGFQQEHNCLFVCLRQSYKKNQINSIAFTSDVILGNTQLVWRTPRYKQH